MSDNYPTTDKRQNNGKSTNRIETGGGDLSTTVQSDKATAAHLSALTGKYPSMSVRSTDTAARANIEQYAEHNVGDIRSSAKSVRAKSKVATMGKKGPSPSAKDAYITAEAKRFKEGGEAIR